MITSCLDFAASIPPASPRQDITVAFGAKPPSNIVQNPYLEQMANQAVTPLLHICLSYGQTGVVDETYIRLLAFMSCCRHKQEESSSFVDWLSHTERGFTSMMGICIM